MSTERLRRRRRWVNRREMHERSAIPWDELAERIEQFDQLVIETTKAQARG